VVYKIGGVTKTQGSSVVITADTTVTASPATGYFFTIASPSWTFNFTG
jgi:hypothetical protein